MEDFKRANVARKAESGYDQRGTILNAINRSETFRNDLLCNLCSLYYRDIIVTLLEMVGLQNVASVSNKNQLNNLIVRWNSGFVSNKYIDAVTFLTCQ